MRTRARSLSPLVVVATLVFAQGACRLAPDYGAVGEERRVHFNSSADDTIFTARVMVGSRFNMVGQALEDDDVGKVVGTGRYVSSDESVLIVHDDSILAGDLELVGPGEAYLEVYSDDEFIDRVALRAARARTMDLGDGTLVDTKVDVRLPGRFALLEGTELPIVERAYDRCAEELVVVMDSVVSSENALVVDVTQADADASTILSAGSVGETTVTLAYENGMSITYEARVAARDEVTEVWPAIGHVEGQTAYLWGRAFVDDDELIAPDLSWSASPRITLSADDGPLTNATIAPDVEGVDGGPAVVTAEFDDVTASLDLYAATTDDLASSRITPPDPEAGPGGCEGNVCDPYAALLVFAVALRRRRLRL